MKMLPGFSKSEPRRKFAAALSFAVALLLASCVSSKYQIAPAVGANPLRLEVKLGGAPVRTQLDAVIIYQGPGSWKKAAYWDELLVTFNNESDEKIILTAVSLVDYAGTIVPAGTDPWQIEKASVAQRERYLKTGVNFALNTLGYAALTYGAVGAGAMAGAAMTSTWAGFTTGAVVGLAAVPVTAVLVYANNQKHKHEIEREFTRRRLPLPLTLRPRESRAGSLFFPMTVSPRELRVEWIKSGNRETCIFPLPMLAGMHERKSAK